MNRASSSSSLFWRLSSAVCKRESFRVALSEATDEGWVDEPRKLKKEVEKGVDATGSRHGDREESLAIPPQIGERGRTNILVVAGAEEDVRSVGDDVGLAKVKT